MMRLTRWIGFGVALAMLTFVATALITPSGTAQPSELNPTIKSTLKTLPHLMGDRIKNSTFDNKVVVLTFFASWCHPCREEFAHLREIYNTYHEEGVEIIAVNAFEDFDNLSNATQLKKYLNLTKPPFTIVKGNDAISQQLGTITRIPTLFVYDKQGRQALHFFNKPDGSQPTIDLETLRQVIITLI